MSRLNSPYGDNQYHKAFRSGRNLHLFVGISGRLCEAFYQVMSVKAVQDNRACDASLLFPGERLPRCSDLPALLGRDIEKTQCRHAPNMSQKATA
jgi:hypothetical protein